MFGWTGGWVNNLWIHTKIITTPWASFLDPDDPERVTSQTRRLGLVVVRGTQVSLVSPEEGTEEIANPFLGSAEDEEEGSWNMWICREC